MISYNGSDLILAPIAGYSDVGMRSLCFRYGAGLCFTEMVSAKGLYYHNENTSELLTIGEDEKHTGVQIFGSDADIIALVARSEIIQKFPIIDINCGCPVPKVFNNGEGSALLLQPEKIEKIVKQLRNAVGDKIVTVKLRKGVKGKKCAIECALAAQEGGADMVTIHGRTREEMYTGQVDYDIIAEVKEKLSIPVCGNGDVVDRESYLKMKQTGVDYVMIARGAIGHPYIFSEIKGEKPVYNIGELIREHIEYLNFMPEKRVVGTMKKHIAAYIKGLKGQKQLKEKVFEAKTLEDEYKIIDIIISIEQEKLFDLDKKKW